MVSKPCRAGYLFVRRGSSPGGSVFLILKDLPLYIRTSLDLDRALARDRDRAPMLASSKKNIYLNPNLREYLTRNSLGNFQPDIPAN